MEKENSTRGTVILFSTWISIFYVFGCRRKGNDGHKTFLLWSHKSEDKWSKKSSCYSKSYKRRAFKFIINFKIIFQSHRKSYIFFFLTIWNIPFECFFSFYDQWVSQTRDIKNFIDELCIEFFLQILYVLNTFCFEVQWCVLNTWRIYAYGAVKKLIFVLNQSILWHQ